MFEFFRTRQKKTDSVKDCTELNRESVKATNGTEKASTDGQTKYIFLYFLEMYASTFLKVNMELLNIIYWNVS